VIKSLQIQNFQSHENTTLEFSEGVNSIIGDSNQGKTAIFRAMLWVLTNRPGGYAFISNWQKKKVKDKIEISGDGVSVIIETDKGKVKRKRNELFNGYIINENEYTAVNRDVPDDIKHVININDVNIQKQLDAHFLLSDSSGKAAEFLNQIIKLDSIDNMFKLIESDKRKNKRSIENKNEEYEKTIKQLDKLKWIDIINPLIIKGEKIEQHVCDSHNIYDVITKEIENYRLQKEIYNKVNIDEIECYIIKVDKIIYDKKEKEKELNRIESDIHVYNENRKIIKKLEYIDLIKYDIIKIDLLIIKINNTNQILKNLCSDIHIYKGHQINYKKGKNIDSICEIIIVIDKIKKELQHTHDVYEEIHNNIVQYIEYKDDIQICDKKINKYNSILPNICPLCGNKMKGNKK